MAMLAARCAVDSVSPGASWKREFWIQAASILRRSWLTLAIVCLAFGFSGSGISAGGVLATLGAIDRVGATVPVAFLRELGVLVTASVAAGAIGTMITAELGARKIREELEALEALGVDPIRNLVMPRILALAAVMPILNMVAFGAGFIGAYLGAVGFYHATPASFVDQFLSNTSFLDLWASEIKVVIFGLIIGVVSSWYGLNVKGGAEGVGRAVNDCVVACIVGCAAVGILYSALFLAMYPDVSVQR
jgi:phospholipid/cholesterol/gamma-HCH transport system permease protein